MTGREEKLKFCIHWSACCRSPSSISLACFKQEEETKIELFCLSKQLGYRIFFRKRPCAIYKDRTLGNVVEEMGGACGTAPRLNDRSMPFQLCASPLKGEVRFSPESSARPSVVAFSEKRQTCTTCLFADSVGL